MNTKHTPGPWKVDRHGVNVMDPREKNYTIANCHGASVRELEANAKLIASAPCLLETLQDVLSYLDLKAEQFAMDYPPEHAIRLSCDRHRDSIRLAIAKATN